MTTALADLDELTLRCRDERARQYIDEAVHCYKAGAFRAAVVVTWIAVCYDLIDKFRELALSGDPQADELVKSLNNARESNDMGRLLRLEASFLELARDKFELLSPVEYQDFERLREDRNRCAHPALISEAERFSPPGELARLHIRNAVEHLLQHPPVQGRHALERLQAAISSEYFPTEMPLVLQSLSSGPLRRPRESLVRNFVVVLLKDILLEINDVRGIRRATAALKATEQLHRAVTNATLADQLSPICQRVPDNELHRIIDLVQALPSCWQAMSADVTNRISMFVLRLPANCINDIDFLLTFEPLREVATVRLQSATLDELAACFFIEPPPSLLDRLLDLYLKAKSYDQANKAAKEIGLFVSDLTADQQRRFLRGAFHNDQVLHSRTLAEFINKLRQSKTLPAEEFEQLLRENGLSLYCLEADNLDTPF